MARQSQINNPSQDELLRALMLGQQPVDTSAAVEGSMRGTNLADSILKNKQAQEDRVRELRAKIEMAKKQRNLTSAVKSSVSPVAGLAADVDPAQASRQILEKEFSERAAKAPKAPAYSKIGETQDEIILADLADPTKQFRVKAPGVGAKGKGTGDLKVAQDRVRKRANIVVSKANDALGRISHWTTGAGGTLANLPMTDARDLRGVLDTIKANLGFAELEQMRQASPTGGALGQIAVKELDFLQSVEGSLDQLQSPEQVKKVVGDIQASYQRILDAMEKDAATPPAGGTPPPAGSPAPNIDVNALGAALGLPRKPR